jgi:hypothetical protein
LGPYFFFLAHAAKMTTRPAGPRLSVRLAVNAVFVILFYVGPAVCVDLKNAAAAAAAASVNDSKGTREMCHTHC